MITTAYSIEYESRRGEALLNGRNGRIETTLAARKRTSYSTTNDQRILQLIKKYSRPLKSEYEDVFKTMGCFLRQSKSREKCGVYGVVVTVAVKRSIARKRNKQLILSTEKRSTSGPAAIEYLSRVF